MRPAPSVILSLAPVLAPSPGAQFRTRAGAVEWDAWTTIPQCVPHTRSPTLVDVTAQVLAVLDEVLSLNGRGIGFAPSTNLRGAVPELDSMAVVSVLAALEDRFGFVIQDDEIAGDTFDTVDTLSRFVALKLQS